MDLNFESDVKRLWRVWDLGVCDFPIPTHTMLKFGVLSNPSLYYFLRVFFGKRKNMLVWASKKSLARPQTFDWLSMVPDKFFCNLKLPPLTW